MFYLIYGGLAAVGGLFLLALVSETIAYELSKGVEAAFDSIEYKLASRAERS
ncbi:MAG TPA: hypothetical protein VF666_13145 [Pyrinomonadaceae bacterium]